MAQVDDLIEPGLEKIVLTAVPTLLRPHRESLPSPHDRTESPLEARLNLQVCSPLDLRTLQKWILPNLRRRPKIKGPGVLHGRLYRIRKKIPHFRAIINDYN
jgi:hypothetical protein